MSLGDNSATGDELPGRPFAPTLPKQATWRWYGQDFNEVGKLEVFIPARNTHPDLHIKARVEDCDGDFGMWEVKENGVTVALGEIKSSDPLWRNGDGPKLEAERVITRGATDEDRARAKAYLEAGHHAAR